MATHAALEGWYREDAGAAHLVGRRCRHCGSYYFPALLSFCRNPDCDSDELKEVLLSRRGVLWSFSKQHYPPPKPYVVPEGEEFQPYIIAAVMLEKEKMIILGQMAEKTDIRKLAVGAPVELVLEPLFRDEQGVVRTIWKWKCC